MLDPQQWKKYILISSYSTTGVLGSMEKFSCALPSPKNIYFRFCLQYYCMGLKVTAIDTRPTTKKMSFWLQYYLGAWDLEFFLIRLDLHQKRNSGYSTTMVHALVISLEHYQKIYIFISDYCGAQNWKIFDRHSIPPKKNCFSFR